MIQGFLYYVIGYELTNILLILGTMFLVGYGIIRLAKDAIKG